MKEVIEIFDSPMQGKIELIPNYSDEVMLLRQKEDMIFFSKETGRQLAKQILDSLTPPNPQQPKIKSDDKRRKV